MNIQSPRRLVIPARRTENRETFLAGLPWFLRPVSSNPEQSGPGLLTFTTDEFIDRFFAGLAKVESGATPDAFERLLPWRDYAEPPAAMIDVSGTRLYPAGIARIPPAPEDLDPGGASIPDEGPHPWLRKLYLPTHNHFHLCAIELACRSHGYPRVGADRVLEAGTVIRRLVRRNDREIWEDWVEGPRGRGAWVAVADPAMQRLNDISRTLDAVDVEAAIPPSTLSDLHTRLQIDTNGGERLELATSRLAKLPKSKSGGDKHTVLYGYLPVYSSALQADDTADATALANARAELRQRAAVALQTAFYGSPVAGDRDARFIAMRRRMRETLSDLLDATVVPPVQPAAADPRTAQVQGLVDNGQLTVYMLDSLRLEATSLAGLQSFWQAVVDHVVQAADAYLASGPIPGTTITFTFNTNASRNWLAHRLRQLLVAIVQDFLPVDPNADTASANRAFFNRIVAVALLRLREFRRDLLVKVTDPAPGPPADTTSTMINTETTAPPLVPRFTVESAAAELTAWLESNTSAWRNLNPLSWPTISLPATAVAAHEAGVALEDGLEEWDEQASNAGSVYADYRNEMIELAIPDADNAVNVQFSDTILSNLIVLPNSTARELGLSLLEQPAYGLFVFPGVLANASSFASTLAGIAGRFSSVSLDRAKSELKARSEAVRPRFDSDSLYAVWAYARIAGRTPCEKNRVVWTGRSDVFHIAEPTDVLGLQPVSIQLPDLKKLVRDLPRIPKARARPNVSVVTPADSGISVGPLMPDTSLQLGLQFVCTHGIPVFTICAWVLFQIIYNILKNLPGFTWMMLMKFCLPGRS